MNNLPDDSSSTSSGQASSPPTGGSGQDPQVFPTDSAQVQNPTPVTSSYFKEAEPSFSESTPVQMVEVGKIPEDPSEKENEIPITRAGDVVLKEPVYDHKGDILMASPTHNVSVLPIKKSTFMNKENWHLPVSSALRWVLTLMGKIVKKNKGEVTFQNE